MDNLGVKTGKLWDIFCKVIDNFGDIGVCWRLATGLAECGERVRLWVDDPSALAWMAPAPVNGIELRQWTTFIQTENLIPGDILLEAFGCEINPEFIAAYAMWACSRDLKPIWINLEYLSAEGFAERNHRLPSPVTSGPGAGLTKHFFYPGFTPATGGLLRETDLSHRQTQFDRAKWLEQQGIEYGQERLISLFCYEPAALSDLLGQLAKHPQRTRLIVTAGRALDAMKACIETKNRLQPLWNLHEQLLFSYLPRLTQLEYDHLLWACDLNFVRGEDSLVRALWANKPFVWHIYPQDDEAHHEKLDAFLKMLKAPASLLEFHHGWNAMKSVPLPEIDLPLWQQTVTLTRSELMKQVDLVTQLMGFVSKNH